MFIRATGALTHTVTTNVAHELQQFFYNPPLNKKIEVLKVTLRTLGVTPLFILSVGNY